MVDVVMANRPNSPLVPVLGLSFYAVASGFLMSLVPLSLVANQLTPALAPWLASVFYLGLLCGAFFIQRVVAVTGHRLAFIGFLLLLLTTVVSQILLPYAWLWLIDRFIAGIAVAGVFVVVESWLLMADTAKQRAKRLGLYMTSLYGGSAVGQLMIKPLGVEGAMPYLFVIALLSMAVLVPLLIKRGQPKQQQSHKLRWQELKNLSRPALVGCLVSGLLLGPIYGLLPMYIMQSDYAPKTGLLMAAVILGGMVVQPLVSYLSPRLNKCLLMALFSLAGVLSLIGVIYAAEVELLVASYLLLGAASFALYPIAITLVCETLAQNKIVSATELMLLAYSLGSVIGPLLAAYVTTSSNSIPWYLTACLATTCVYMLLTAKRRVPDQDSPVAEL
ncbi:MFS transporter [Bowmanella yangjiangensis]|uniref:MFS transporter n=1 Tax=Bowmanella yangjiangensis TaxID=2811230 RepID=A0ABS3CPM6_9ALTE|nr:MFS transporter [Bowmanella yangjiangensis]MBN7818489.1 MFS transporter [Bowmanella yangjiangensis]